MYIYRYNTCIVPIEDYFLRYLWGFVVSMISGRKITRYSEAFGFMGKVAVNWKVINDGRNYAFL